ncbi:M15 family metallopeptidase [Flavobacterium sp.]|uniref:M15 family metallopeptidase n=1 Tax=Flavobacterium sp. TaxID=239 RepID=UPI00286A7DB7|nr:M15 family metallopeptidase [Flavobacterium sp.]
MNIRFIYCIIMTILVWSCKTQNVVVKKTFFENNQSSLTQNDTTFVNLSDYSNEFILDLKYATDDNFLKSKMYECGTCFLRLKTLNNLIEANKEFKKKGYKIKLFDCYRPLQVQRKMWALVPNPEYVANPTKGSIHNRGGAVDITLVDEAGNELDMGSAFDFFGAASSHFYKELPKEVLKNRQLLKKIMLRHNFESFDSEWWHYNLKGSRKDKISNFVWECH